MVSCCLPVTCLSFSNQERFRKAPRKKQREEEAEGGKTNTESLNPLDLVFTDACWWISRGWIRPLQQEMEESARCVWLWGDCCRRVEDSERYRGSLRRWSIAVKMFLIWWRICGPKLDAVCHSSFLEVRDGSQFLTSKCRNFSFLASNSGICFENKERYCEMSRLNLVAGVIRGHQFHSGWQATCKSLNDLRDWRLLFS